jgi:hypothetical protein
VLWGMGAAIAIFGAALVGATALAALALRSTREPAHG